MTGYVEVQDPAATVLDGKQTIELLPHHCGRGKEIESHDHLAMILQEGQPVLPGVAAAGYTWEIASHSPLGDLETEL
jgi:hypothetical protein